MANQNNPTHIGEPFHSHWRTIAVLFNSHRRTIPNQFYSHWRTIPIQFNSHSRPHCDDLNLIVVRSWFDGRSSQIKSNQTKQL